MDSRNLIESDSNTNERKWAQKVRWTQYGAFTRDII